MVKVENIHFENVAIFWDIGSIINHIQLVCWVQKGYFTGLVAPAWPIPAFLTGYLLQQIARIAAVWIWHVRYSVTS
jgi:hypothetical protein